MKREKAISIILILLMASFFVSVKIPFMKADSPSPINEWSQTYGGTGYDRAQSMIKTGDGGYAIIGYTDSYGSGGYDAWLVKTDANGTAQWNQTYGGTNYDYGVDLVETDGDGYAIAGYTYSYGAGNVDVWLVKTDAAGNELWNQTYGGPGYDFGLSVVQTGDGGYAMAGVTDSFSGNYDVWVIKTDAAGVVQWNQTYGGIFTDHWYSLVETSDGGYVIAGHTYSYGAGSYDAWLIKTDAAGNELWNQTYGGTDIDSGLSVVETNDGGYAIAGYTQSYGAGSADVWLVKTNATGTVEWDQTYGGTDTDYGVDLVQTSDDDYVIAGHTYSYGAGSADVLLVETDIAGAVQWTQTYGGASDDYGVSVVETSDDDYVIAGYTYSYGAGSADFWLVKTSGGVPSSKTEWSQTYGGTGYDRAQSMIKTGDGGYAIIGYTDSYGSGGYDAWLVKTDANGTAQWNQTYGGTNDDYGTSVVETSDGGYAIAGYTYSYGAGDLDVWLVKTDATGTAEWNQTYGGTSYDFGMSVVETIDGGYAIAGITTSYGSGYWNTWLVKTDATGTAEWNQTYGGIATDRWWSLVETDDGGYAIAGLTNIGGYDAWLVETDDKGTAQWNQTYGGTGNDFALSLVRTDNSGYAIAGYTDSYGTGYYDVWLVKTDATGTAEWNQTYGGTGFDYGASLVKTSDNGYAIAGHTDSYGTGGYDVWLVKTDGAGTLQWTQTYGGASDDYGVAMVETNGGGYVIAGYTYSYSTGSADFWLIKISESGIPPVTINDYDGLWHTSDFTINLLATSPNEIFETYYRINKGSIQTVSTNGQPQITSESAANVLEYWSVDNVGNQELPHKMLTQIKLDKTAPLGSLTVNDGAVSANSTSVTLTLSAYDAVSDVSQMRFSNDGVSWSIWEVYSTIKGWTLTAGDGTKTVYAQFKNGAGLDSVAYDSIDLIQEVPAEVLYFNVTYGETDFVVETCSNSSVSDLSFNQQLKRLRFTVNGADGTTGFCNVTVPEELMSGNFSLYIDDLPLTEGEDYNEVYNGTHYTFSITYVHSSHLIELISTNVIPDFAAWLFLPFLMAATLLRLVLRKRQKNKDPYKNRRG